MQNCHTHTLLEMLEDRGVQTQSLRKMFEDDDVLNHFASWVSDDSTTCVMFCLSKGLAVDARDAIEREINNDLPRNYIVIVSEKISSGSANNFESLDQRLREKKGGMVQVFTLKELQFNPSRHTLVPKHVKLNEEEVLKVLELYQLKSKAQLPLIMRSDPMARYLGLKQQDVVRIHRVNETSGEALYYRCCA